MQEAEFAEKRRMRAARLEDLRRRAVALHVIGEPHAIIAKRLNIPTRKVRKWLDEAGVDGHR